MESAINNFDMKSLKEAFLSFHTLLEGDQLIINRLNVYPVPDGDTGTNMYLTVSSVVEEISKLGEDANPSDLKKAISHGALMGARGNSGIILSQILTGLVSELDVNQKLDVSFLVRAFHKAAELARQSVMRPIEGTILTVIAATSESIREAALQNSDLRTVLNAGASGAISALKLTPELLPVLAESGVVDAGGAGVVLLLQAFVSAICNCKPANLNEILPKDMLTNLLASSSIDFQSKVELADEIPGGLRYEVMFLLEAPEDSIRAFKDVWAGFGDSIVVVGHEDIYNCHIHTNDIGAAIEAGIDTGRVSRIRVTDLREQIEEESWVARAEPVSDKTSYLGPPPVTAVVAVATGSGIKRIFHSLGVHEIVTGGQSMNPSTKELLEAVERVPSTGVIILPNNKNIIPVANEVDTLTEKSVRVVPTSSVVEGFAALLEYDPEAGPGENLVRMEEASKRVTAAQVTQAVRDAVSEVGQIKTGDYLGITAEGIQVVKKSMADACTALLEKLISSENEIVTVIEGEHANQAVTRAIKEFLSERFPFVSVEVHEGDQPLYPYLFSIE